LLRDCNAALSDQEQEPSTCEPEAPLRVSACGAPAAPAEALGEPAQESTTLELTASTVALWLRKEQSISEGPFASSTITKKTEVSICTREKQGSQPISLKKPQPTEKPRAATKSQPKPHRWGQLVAAEGPAGTVPAKEA